VTQARAPQVTTLCSRWTFVYFIEHDGWCFHLLGALQDGHCKLAHGREQGFAKLRGDVALTEWDVRRLGFVLASACGLPHLERHWPRGRNLKM
jgi:hypothetical protein